MRKYQITNEARRDLGSIWRWLADNESESVADHVIAGIYAEFDRVVETPGQGHYRDELLNRNYRFWTVWSYLIVYRWQVEPIQIVAIVHGARDLATFFDESKR